MNLAEALKYLFPNSVPLVDWIVRDDGSGPYIAKFDEAKLGVRPTATQLEAAWQAAQAARATTDALVLKLKKGDKMTVDELAAILRSKL